MAPYTIDGFAHETSHGELTHGMALGGHILLGNHEIIHADELTPVTCLYPI